MLPPAKYLSKIQGALADEGSAIEMPGSILIVETIPEPERKTSSGLILSASGDGRNINAVSADKPNWCRVLAVGAGYFNDTTGAPVPLETAPGDIILVGTSSVKWLPWLMIDKYQPYDIGITREEEIQLKFKGGEGFERFFRAVNR